MSRKPIPKLVNKWSRKVHRWCAIAVALPLSVVICSGVLLQLKKQYDWIQPPMQRGEADVPTIGFDAILAAASAVPEAEIESWADIDRLDVRPGQGIVKVRGKTRWEVQVDTATGEVLQVKYRRSDLIESIHDGSWFHEKAKLWVFLPNGLILLCLLFTGLYLWILPIWAKRSARARRASTA
ncbi:MAG: PepSY domain-containing protein [Planctomycetes bacterium]|nr:PepSY domain-containing protein [Planctomycetota bacterium]